jgi:glutamate racemase
MKKTSPIGIFDSGIGGLTVAKAIHQQFPNIPIIYYGDTAHFPYGEKTEEQIQSYAKDICDFLLSKNCNIILIACNSASAAAYDFVCQYVGNRAKVFNVIDPVVDYVASHYLDKKIGLIATTRTVNSKAYEKKLTAICPAIDFKAVATAELAPMIEEHMNDGQYDKKMIHQYLSHPDLKKIEVLILACTHYPLIKNEIDLFYDHKVEIIDASDIVAKSLHLSKDTSTIAPQFHFSKPSPNTESFVQQLFGKK